MRKCLLNENVILNFLARELAVCVVCLILEKKNKNKVIGVIMNKHSPLLAKTRDDNQVRHLNTMYAFYSQWIRCQSVINIYFQDNAIYIIYEGFKINV